MFPVVSAFRGTVAGERYGFSGLGTFLAACQSHSNYYYYCYYYIIIIVAYFCSHTRAATGVWSALVIINLSTVVSNR